MDISENQKNQTIKKIQYILNDQFVGPKTDMKIHRERLNFACPYCRDSNDQHKKRGNLYWKSLQFHCYNSGCSKRHTNLVEFLKDFNQGVTDKNDLIFFLDYIRENQIVIATKDYLELDVFTNMENYSIPLDVIKKKLNLQDPADNTKINAYLKSRLLHRNMQKFLYDPIEDQLYIFNFTNGTHKVIGWQIRNFKIGKTKYVSYNIEKINHLILDRRIELPDDDIIKMNTISIYFNLMSINFESPVTIFEGPIDSFLFTNSISISGIDKPTEMFDDISTIRYLFDNDGPGRRKMEHLLKRKKTVFMWNKLLKDYKIRKPIKDFNELLDYCWRQKNEAIQNINQYFTNNPLDIRYV